MTKIAKIIMELEIRIEMLDKFIEAEVNSLFPPDIQRINIFKVRKNELVNMLSFIDYTLREKEYTNE